MSKPKQPNEVTLFIIVIRPDLEHSAYVTTAYSVNSFMKRLDNEV